MTELEAKAKDCIENHTHKLVDKPSKQDIYLREESIFISGYRLGATENGIQWHKVTDWKNTEQFPQEESFPYFVVTKKDGYYLCEWEIDEGCGQFYSMYEGADIDPEDVVLWAKIEIPQFNSEE